MRNEHGSSQLRTAGDDSNAGASADRWTCPWCSFSTPQAGPYWGEIARAQRSHTDYHAQKRKAAARNKSLDGVHSR